MKKRILMVAPAWLGDLVMAQSLLQWGCQELQASIDVLVPSALAPAAARLSGVHQVLPHDFLRGELGLRSRYQMGVRLRDATYDQAWVLPLSWKSALVPCFARIPKRTGFLGEQRWGLVNDVRYLKSVSTGRQVDWYRSLGIASDSALPSLVVPKLDIDIAAQAQVIARLGIIMDNKPILAICPGAAYGPAKRWPVHHVVKVVDWAMKQGMQVWLLGAQSDQAIAQDIVSQTASSPLNLVGQTSLTEVIDLLALARMALCNDSGLMHVAAAVNCQVFALFGSSSPLRTPPLQPSAKIFEPKAMSCRPCFKRECRYGHTDCLENISPKTVIDAIGQVI